MEPLNGKILVSVNLEQKDTMLIEGVEFKTALSFDKNYRERSPVLCKVVGGNEVVQPGQMLISHHNFFYQPSPYYLQDDLFAIPFGKSLFAVLNFDGSVSPICGNLFCERVYKETLLDVPPEQMEQYIDRVKVTDGGGTTYQKDDLVFTRPHSYYEIVYFADKIEHRIFKCDSEMVLGVIKAKK